MKKFLIWFCFWSVMISLGIVIFSNNDNNKYRSADCYTKTIIDSLYNNAAPRNFAESYDAQFAAEHDDEISLAGIYSINYIFTYTAYAVRKNKGMNEMFEYTENLPKKLYQIKSYTDVLEFVEYSQEYLQ